MRTPYRLPAERYLDHIRAESDRFGAALGDVDPAARVPSCPDWDAADLLWHLTEVQWFWSRIVAERPRGPEVTEGGRRPERPAPLDELRTAFRRCSAGLVHALAAAADTEPAWTWYPPEQTVGFTYRRQAHEALIHRLDAELVAGHRTPLDPALATDGVDEVLQVMFGGIPEWATFTRQHGPLAVRTTDTGARWAVEVGRQSGVHPESGERVEDPTLDIRDHGADVEDAETVARISADAATLDAWLWGRVDDRLVETGGDQAALAAFTAVVRTGIQ